MNDAKDDPIVAEVRAARRALMEEVGNDIGKLFEYLKRQQEESGREYVRFPPKRIESASTNTGSTS